MKKICSRCGELRLLSEFYRHRAHRDGLTSECKPCNRRADKAFYATNGDVVRAKSAKRYAENKNAIIQRQKLKHAKDPRFVMLVSARRRAKRHDVPFDLKIDDVIVPETCPILGIELLVGDGCSKDYSPSLDRIIPERGYVAGNVHVISHKANTIKSNATVSELHMVARWAATQFYPHVGTEEL